MSMLIYILLGAICGVINAARSELAKRGNHSDICSTLNIAFILTVVTALLIIGINTWTPS